MEASTDYAVLPHFVGGTESDWATTFTILKAIMGAGGFALPWAFARSGLSGGVVAVVACAGLGTFTVRELVAMKAHTEVVQGRFNATYVDVAREAFGAVGASIVYVLTLVCTLGGLSAYLVFIGTTLHSLLPNVDQQVLTVLIATVLLPVTWMREFSFLSRLAGCGICAVLAGYGVTLDYAIRAQHSFQGDGPPASAPVDWASMARGFGPIAYLFCVHLILFPVISASQAAARPGGFDTLASRAFCLACLVNGVFAATAFLAFGGEVSSIAINDIPQGTWYVVATKLLLCLDLFCTYPLMLAASRQLLEQSLLTEKSAGGPLLNVFQHPDAKKRAIRTALVLVTLLLAQLKDFGVIISLVGSFGLVITAFVLPPLMSLKLLGQEMNLGRWGLNLLVLPLGCTVAALATTMTLVEVLGNGR